MIALESLVASGKLTEEAVAPFLKNESADIRALAVGTIPVALIDLKTTAMTDASPMVRAEAMRRLTDPMAKNVLLQALESDDPFIQEAARLGLRRSLTADELVALAGGKIVSPRQRLGLLLIVRDLDHPGTEALLPEFLADPDPLIRFAATQWIGEHRLKGFRPQLLAGLSSATATKNLFEATLVALEQLDGKTHGPKEEVAGQEYIVHLLNDPHTSSPVLERGLRMLPPGHPALSFDRLRRLATDSDRAVAIEAVRTLSQSSMPARFAFLNQLAIDRSGAIAASCRGDRRAGR